MSLRATIRSVSDPTKIVTPAYRKWLKHHYDDPKPQWVAELMQRELQKVARDRRASFSGSSAGTCLRAQEFGYLGIEPPIDAIPSTDLLSIFDDGRWRHLRWQVNLLSAGILDRIEVPLSWPAKRSEGSMDGAGIVSADHPNKKWRGLEFGFELKGMNGFQFGRLMKARFPKPTEKHLAQVDRYLLSSGFDLFVVLYECKLTQRTMEWVIERDEDAIEESAEELDALNEAVDLQQIHPQLMSCSLRKGPSWESCPYAGKGGICEQWRDQGKVWL